MCKLSGRSSKFWGMFGSKLLGFVRQCLATGRAGDGGRARGTMRCSGECWGHHMAMFYGARASKAPRGNAEKCWGTWPTTPAVRLYKGAAAYPVRIFRRGMHTSSLGQLAQLEQARQKAARATLETSGAKVAQQQDMHKHLQLQQVYSNCTRGALVISRVVVVLLRIL